MFAGISTKEITPLKPLYLTGYPHAERIMRGVNDPLLSSAVCLKNKDKAVMMIALDLLFIEQETARELRKAIQAETGIDEKNVFISCTHTHSGPLTVKVVAWKNDPTVPEIDMEYMQFLKDTIVASALEASGNMFEAEAAWTSTQINGVGGNRHDPNGLRDPEAGILVIRDKRSRKIMSLSVIYGVHPTVLHEDSRMVSSDFPGYARKYLQDKLGRDLDILYHLGPAGNQGPRHYVKEQTFGEAERLGTLLGSQLYRRIESLSDGDFTEKFEIDADIVPATLPRKRILTMKDAVENLWKCRETLESLKKAGAGHGPERTAECSIFGAEETIALAEAEENGELAEVIAKLNPVDVQVLQLGDTFLAGLPSEIFAEYGLALKKRFTSKVYTASLVNGYLQGYITTPDAADKGCYESSFSVFKPEAGTIMIDAAAKIINKMLKKTRQRHKAEYVLGN